MEEYYDVPFWDSCCGGHATSTWTWVPVLPFFHSTLYLHHIHYYIILYRFSRSRKLYPHNVTIINNELKVCSRMMMFHTFLLWRISYLCRIHLQISYFNSIKLNLEFNKKIYSCYCRCAYLLKSKWVGVSFLVLLFDFVSVASEIFLFFFYHVTAINYCGCS